MFTTPYVYLYFLSSIFAFTLSNTSRKINPRTPAIVPLMALNSTLCTIANFVLLAICLFKAEHWWYAIVMWAMGVVGTILIPPTRFETIMGYIGFIVAPLCITLAYLNIFGVI